jgi:hypothetical protein
MFRLSLIPRRVFLLFTLIVLLSILGCASTQLVPDADTEKWIGKISGMAKGDLELFIKQTQGQGDFHSVTGPFVMYLKTTGGYGSGKVKGNVKGIVKNGIMKAKISGHAQVEDGSSHISGTMIGTISKTQAFGTWSLGHIEGFLSGKWTAEKALP